MPLTRGITAAREFGAGASLADIAPLLGGQWAVEFVYFVPGYFLFQACEIVAKRRGTWEVFQRLKQRHKKSLQNKGTLYVMDMNPRRPR